VQERQFDGVIIRTFPSGDFDLVLRVASPQSGKLSLFAKGARGSGKRFRTRFDILDTGTFAVRDGANGMVFLESFRGQESFPNIRADLDKISCASLMCECTDRLLLEGHSEMGGIARTLIIGLRAVNDAPDLRSTLKHTFLILVSLLHGAGLFSASVAPTPSATNLLRLLDHIENVTEHPLATRDAIQSSIGSLRDTRSTTDEENGREKSQ